MVRVATEGQLKSASGQLNLTFEMGCHLSRVEAVQPRSGCWQEVSGRIEFEAFLPTSVSRMCPEAKTTMLCSGE